MRSKNAIKQSLLLATVLLLFIKASAQTSVEQPSEVKSLNKIGFYLIGIGLEREQKMSGSSTISIGVNYQLAPVFESSYSLNAYNVGGVVYSGTPTVKRNLKLVPTAGASMNYRYYYNVEKRQQKNKITMDNSADYLSLEASAVFPRMFNKNRQSDYQVMITPNWGLQRKMDKIANGEFAIGPSVVINPYETLISVGLKAGFSIIF